jgi:DNA polymerase-3 subunit delta'
VPLTDLLGHRQLLDHLVGELSGRPSHAYLFTGRAGIGKRLVAEALAHSLLCERSPGTSFCCTPDKCPVREQALPRKRGEKNPTQRCECCTACVQIAAKVHPDYIAIAKPAGRTDVLIEQVRELIAKLGTKPARGPLRVAIIDDAEFLNIPAQNALLKTLEEPPGYAIIILIAAAERLLLDTVRSRLRAVRFGPLSTRDIATLLERRGVDAKAAIALAPLARGSAARALALAEGDQPPIEELLNALKGAREMDFVTARALSDRLFKGREEASENFELLARLLEEALVAKVHREKGETPGPGEASIAKLMSEIVDSFSTDAILVSLNGAVQASSAVEAMANPRLQAEQWWLSVGRVLRGES